MKFCIRCATAFESKTDKYRKHCYGCVPFGTRMLVVDRQGDRTCIVCNRPFLYNKDRRNGSTTKKCSSCSVNGRRQVKKQMALVYKGGCCFICKYDRCPRALVFHHINEGDKDFGIGGKHTLSWERIRQELDKCVLLCTNCHAEVHDGVAQLPLGAELVHRQV